MLMLKYPTNIYIVVLLSIVVRVDFKFKYTLYVFSGTSLGGCERVRKHPIKNQSTPLRTPKGI
ncbi:hypothetical protein C0J52_21723 [Blattella germanica]|nr:hypothetical protein C0J52_21723 [Blattella germanica]